MSKELEALKTINIKCHPNSNPSPAVDEALEIVKNALERLQSIDNANPSEALKDLKELHELAYGSEGWKIEDIVQSLHIKQALIKAQEQKKVLEIIKEKGFDEDIKDYNDYNIWVEYKVEQFAKAIDDNPTILNWDMFDKFTYTKEEFDLLKEWLNE